MPSGSSGTSTANGSAAAHVMIGRRASKPVPTARTYSIVQTSSLNTMTHFPPVSVKSTVTSKQFRTLQYLLLQGAQGHDRDRLQVAHLHQGRQGAARPVPPPYPAPEPGRKEPLLSRRADLLRRSRDRDHGCQIPSWLRRADQKRQQARRNRSLLPQGPSDQGRHRDLHHGLGP